MASSLSETCMVGNGEPTTKINALSRKGSSPAFGLFMIEGHSQFIGGALYEWLSERPIAIFSMKN